MKKVKWLAATLLLVVGLGIFLSPDLYSIWFASRNQQIVSDFQEQYAPVAPQNQEEPVSKKEPTVLDERLVQAQQYNEQIFRENQAGMSDAWTFTQSAFSVQFEDDLFGYVEIPAMDVSLPLYLGATKVNMAKGAVVLGETSVPVGGVNTNAVIAGHRGYQGAPYFREIEKLSVGDEVRVTNPWETLVYKVTDLAVIQPDDSDAIRIQPGKDMVTLVTCHPYRSHGKYRYVVYCERVLSEDAMPDCSGSEEIQHHGTVEYQTSEPDIQEENNIRIVGAAIILILLVFGMICCVKRERL